MREAQERHNRHVPVLASPTEVRGVIAAEPGVARAFECSIGSDTSAG